MPHKKKAKMTFSLDKNIEEPEPLAKMPRGLVTRNSASIESLKQMQSYFDEFNTKLSEIGKLKISQHESAKIRVEKTLDCETAQNELNTTREALIDKAKQRLCSMLKSEIDANFSKHLDKLKRERKFQNVADELKNKMIQCDIDGFVSKLKYQQFHDPYLEIDLENLIASVVAKDEQLLDELKVIPISFDKFLFGYRSDAANYHYYIVDRLRSKVISQTRFFLPSCKLKVYAKNNHIMFTHLLADYTFNINVYDMNFELKATRTLDSVSFKKFYFTSLPYHYRSDEFVRVNDTYIIVYFDDLHNRYLEYYDMAKKKLLHCPTETPCYSWLADVTNDYLLFLNAKKVFLLKINTNETIFFHSKDDHVVLAANIFSDLPYLIMKTGKHVSIIRYDNQTVLYKFFTDDFFPDLSYSNPQYELSSNQDVLFAFKNTKPILTCIKSSSF
jgi:hypothetical protein